jgi:hypothetical protein
MSKLLGWLASTTIGAAIVTVTPAVAFQGAGFEGGMGGMRARILQEWMKDVLAVGVSLSPETGLSRLPTKPAMDK